MTKRNRKTVENDLEINNCEKSLNPVNFELLQDYLTTPYDSILENFEKESIDFYYNSTASHIYSSNNNMTKIYQIILIYKEDGFKAFSKIFGKTRIYSLINKYSDNDYLTQDELNFIKSIFTTSLCMELIKKVSTDFLINYCIDCDSTSGHDNFIKISVLLELLTRDIDIKKYNPVIELENYIKSLYTSEELEKINAFDPINNVIDTQLKHHIKNEIKGVFTLYVINKSDFLEKIAVIALTEVKGIRVEIKGAFDANTINTTKDDLLKFMLKYRPSLVRIACNLDINLLDNIDKINITKKDIYNAFKPIDIFKENEDFILEKSNKLNYSKDLIKEEYSYYGQIIEFFKDDVITLYGLCFFGTKNLFNEKDFRCNSFIKSFDRDKYPKDEFFDRLIFVSFTINITMQEFDIIYLNKYETYDISCGYMEQMMNIFSLNSSNFDLCTGKLIQEYSNNLEVLDMAAKFLSTNNEFNDKVIKNYKKYNTVQRFLIIRIINLNIEKYSKDFINLSDSNKINKLVIADVYRENPCLKELLLKMLNSKKLLDRKNAFIGLSAYGLENLEDIKTASENEINEKLKKDMLNFITLAPLDNNKETITIINNSNIIEMLLSQEEFIKLIPIEKFTKIKDVEIDKLKASLILFAKDNITGFCPVADEIVKDFDRITHQQFVKDLFNFYIKTNADTKRKWILSYCSIYGSDEMVDLYIKSIDKFVSESRGAMAGETVKAMSLNSSPKALLKVEEISRKYKHKQVKKSALQTLDFIANELNISVYELGDRLIPDFGFDDEMKLIFDFGTRKFNVYLNTNLDLEIVDEKGKVMKNLPKIGVNDNAKIAKNSTERFKEIKKLIKATIKAQSERLEMAILNGRTWTYENFTELFVKNPIMYKFATSLIWGVYENHKLITTFRYSDDGTFSTVDDEEFTLKENMIIGIIHPIELDENLLNNWKEQLEDYEIKQSILQLQRPVFYVKDEDSIIDEKIQYSTSSLKTKLTKIGFTTGKVLDEGYFYTFEYNNLSNDLKAEIEFSGMSITYNDWDEPYCTIKKITFNKTIKDVPQKIISEIYYILSTVTILNTED